MARKETVESVFTGLCLEESRNKSRARITPIDMPCFKQKQHSGDPRVMKTWVAQFKIERSKDNQRKER